MDIFGVHNQVLEYLKEVHQLDFLHLIDSFPCRKPDVETSYVGTLGVLTQRFVSPGLRWSKNGVVYEYYIPVTLQKIGNDGFMKMNDDEMLNNLNEAIEKSIK